MYALITRPINDIELCKNLLLDLGIKSIIDPLLEINYINLDKLYLTQEEIEFTIITSKNALRGLNKLIINKATPLLVVGPATAALARTLGFKNIKFIGQDAAELINYINQYYVPNDKIIIYLSAKIISSNIDDILMKQGFNMHRVVVYEAKAKEDFYKETIDLLRVGKIELFIFLSVRTAAIFVDLVNKNQLNNVFYLKKAFVLSYNIAKVLQKLSWHSINIAKEKNLKSLINSIGEFYGK